MFCFCFFAAHSFNAVFLSISSRSNDTIKSSIFPALNENNRYENTDSQQENERSEVDVHFSHSSSYCGKGDDSLAKSGRPTSRFAVPWTVIPENKARTPQSRHRIVPMTVRRLSGRPRDEPPALPLGEKVDRDSRVATPSPTSIMARASF